MVPRAANRRAGDPGNNDDAHRRVHCVATLYDEVGFDVANALDSTFMGDFVVMRGWAEKDRAPPLPEPCQALAANAAVPRIISRGRRTFYLELLLDGRLMEALDMARGLLQDDDNSALDSS